MRGRTPRPLQVVVPPSVGVLEPYVRAGIFDAYEVQLATSMSRLDPGVTPGLALGLALAARAPRFGHVCAELGATAELVPVDGELTDRPLEVDWPAVGSWIEELADSPLVGVAVKDGLPGQSGLGSRIRPLVLDGGRLYLQRYWHYEVAVADDLEARAARSGEASGDRAAPAASLERVLDDLFGPDDPHAPDLQRLGAARALTTGVSILAGGPGTGKTHTIARILVAAHRLAAEEGKRLEVALAAPTGKAAARMRAAVSTEVDQVGRGPGHRRRPRGPVVGDRSYHGAPPVGLAPWHPIPPRPPESPSPRSGGRGRDLHGGPAPDGQAPRRDATGGPSGPGGGSVPTGQHRGGDGDG